MNIVTKYNACKALSIILTTCTPIITLFSCSSLYVNRSDSTMSAAGVLMFMILWFIFKDKLLENFKFPSPVLFCFFGLIVALMIRSIIDTIIYMFGTSFIAVCIDALTFRSVYKKYDILLPRKTKAYKHFGFIFAKNKTIEGLHDE